MYTKAFNKGGRKLLTQTISSLDCNMTLRLIKIEILAFEMIKRLKTEKDISTINLSLPNKISSKFIGQNERKFRINSP